MRFTVKRLALAVPSLIGISILTFVLVRLVPGSAIEARLGTSLGLTKYQLRTLRHYFGLDIPIWKHYFIWLWALLNGDLGISIRTGTSVTSLIGGAIPVTAELAACALTFALLVGMSVGLISATKSGTWLDAIGRTTSLLGLSVPDFWLGTLLVLFFSRVILWLPNSNSYTPPTQNVFTNLTQMLMPALVLAAGITGAIVRTTRSAVLDVLDADYTLTARAKGLPPRRILTAHIFRNALIPIITIAGVLAGYLLTGAIIVEQIFNLPGLGRLLLTSIQQRDYAVVQGTVLVVAGLFVLMNLLADLAYGLADPRIRQS